MKFGFAFVVALLFVLLVGGRTAASWILDYEWWSEVGQVSTWISMMLYSVGPSILAAILAFIVFWTAHARGMKSAGTRLSEFRGYARIATLVIFVVSIIYGAVVIDSWTIVRYFGGRGGTDAAWQDPVFGHPLAFYLFELPFYSEMLQVVQSLCLIGGIIYWLTGRGWSLRGHMPANQEELLVEITNVTIARSLESGFLRGLLGVFLLALGMRFYLDRYDLLLVDHGFMVGVDWVADTIKLPLIWATIGACVAAAVFLWFRMYKLVVLMVVFPILSGILPPLVNSLYVRPNEISIQKPYIQRHIEATRSAFALNQRTIEKDYPAKADVAIDVTKNRVLLDNVRLWDWRAFHDTVSQIQPLRPYTYSDTDVDRYNIDGQMRQVLVSPREIDLNQLGDARTRWTNPRLVYTHGYGLVMAEANRITQNGLPVLFIRDAPPQVMSKSLKVTRPELYYGEEIHEPVFVNTAQAEFNYPSGADNVQSRYEGKGGFPISSVFMRFFAALRYGDWNIVLTSQLAPNSRMMIHRSIRERLRTIAGFVEWDADPYLVLTDAGRMVWMVDGYVTSRAHPYSRMLSLPGIGSFNYIRNSVKATVDAYDGTTKLYVFDAKDPLIRAYQNLFPTLLSPASEMPADLRAHARYPETIFRAQAEAYRMYHMRDPEAFYNRSDQWDIARSIQGQEGQPQPAVPTYVIATLPGEKAPEFTLLIPFTPRNKDNLIGLMMARCDGDKLGELNILLLSKQEVLLGPMQVEARINQDQNISKDLTLWNQQGSQVLRGQMMVLPLDGTFLYVEPIYIQAKEARMPQLRKVVVAVGNSLIYADTYEQALAQLPGVSAQQQAAATPAAPVAAPVAGAAETPAAPSPPATQDQRVQTIRGHLQRYRDLSAQGKWAEAGRELEAVESLVKR